jgi:hypothetical protein
MIGTRLVTVENYLCGNCGAVATHGVRSNGPKDLSVWMLVMVPTGARVEAFLCRECLTVLTHVEYGYGEGVHYAYAQYSAAHDGRSGIMRKVKHILRSVKQEG